ncbi:MAG: NUDIX domain-containing protein [Prevotellaceae bacterium]|jgi:mutator protein MutT|nr:NUDIX domain-containing protein [Prevotellaceae bacterium]
MDAFYPSQVWKYCPYCGSQKMEWKGGTHCMCCGNCKQRFFINASAAVAALIENEKGELIFTRRKNDPAKNMLDLPGGFIDLGETAEEAVRRELKEELNVDIDDLNYFGSFPNRYLYDGIVYFTLDMVFRCRVNNLSTLQAGDDVGDYVFIAPKNIIPEEIGLDSIRSIAQMIKLKEDPPKQKKEDTV